MNDEPDPAEWSNGIGPITESDAGAGMPPDGSSRREPDPVRAKLEAMFDLLRRPADPASQPSENRIDETSQARQRFRIIRPHAKGGLGEVWVALDEELNRDVAFKEIQFRYAGHAESRSRFLREATVTGQLEHPGIIPVYAVGEQDDGRPFYAMRLIQGDSLQKAIGRFHQAHGSGTDPQQRQLELRKLLDRFIDVCNAVAYAHSRGVIHRDLKPDNIMLGAFGETLVVDWGLAKSVTKADVNDAARTVPVPTTDTPVRTQIGATIGTPAYMSPEQAAGRTAELGPLSDVYSLGATLYCILTGQPPFTDSNLETVLSKVQRGAFPRPREVNPAVAPALEAVCLKAMALDPADRYASAQALADDLEHWLADEAISALPDPLATRLYRWSRRHKPVVTGLSALLVTGMLALGVSNVLLKKEQERTEIRRLEAVAAERRAVASRRDAEASAELAHKNEVLAREQKQFAEQQEQRAVRKSTLALSSLTALITGVQEKLQSRPGTQDLRRDLLETARIGLESLLEDSEISDERDGSNIWCHNKLGDLFLESARATQAAEHFAEAARLAEQAVSNRPADQQRRHDLVNSLRGLGQAAQATGNLPLAKERFNKAVEVARINAAIENSRQNRRDMEMLYNNLGDIARRLGDLPTAIEYFKLGFAVAESLFTDAPDNPFMIQDMLVAYQRLGETHTTLGKPDDALTFLDKNVTLAKQYVERDPRDILALGFLARAYCSRGDLHLRLGQLQFADQDFEQNLSIVEPIGQSNPSNFDAQRAIAVAHDRLATTALRLGDLQSARLHCERGNETTILMLKIDPSNVQLQRDSYTAMLRLGTIRRLQNDIQGAMAEYQKSMTLAEAVLELERDKNPELVFDVETIRGQIVLSHLAVGNAADAIAESAKSSKLLEVLVSEHPENSRYHEALALAFSYCGDAAYAARQWPSARSWFEKNVNFIESMDKEFGSLPTTQFALGYSYAWTGYCLMQEFDYGQAVKHFDHALQIMAKMRAAGTIVDQRLFDTRESAWKNELAFSLSAAKALDDLEFAASQPQPLGNRLLATRALAFLSRGDHVRAAATAERLGQFYTAACFYSLCAAAVGKDKHAEPLSIDEAELRDRYSARAIELLKQARAAGVFTKPESVANLKQNNELDPLRTRNDFKKLVEELEAKIEPTLPGK